MGFSPSKFSLFFVTTIMSKEMIFSYLLRNKVRSVKDESNLEEVRRRFRDSHDRKDLHGHDDQGSSATGASSD
ncbi:hypothetical protein AKJ41_05620 [candidate division MSBL1 archaeon SCGC-AAA259O05]|uniref:Uncharacterized protein n=1 Tax=candidate division MSBL1 archaeon SCGC-AAA259O05 TaxID=1698271 RepID=A0A133UYS9_9EURY|nr:hypothetical protein AKJ41_05620 [candidate division MSBL1 archaeon SCGC-AAA259O05]